MDVGDRTRIDGMSGLVVALISQGKFAPGYPADAWAILVTGVLVLTEEAGLIHYPNPDEYEIQEISGLSCHRSQPA